MKKIFFGAIILGNIFFLSPAYAAITISQSPTNPTIAQVSSTVLTFNASVHDNTAYYLFTSGGISVSDLNAGVFNSDSPQNITGGILKAFDLASPAAGGYFWYSFSYDTWSAGQVNSWCSTGNSYASCVGNTAGHIFEDTSSTFNIVNSTSSANTAYDNINDPPSIFNFILYDIVYTSIVVIIAGIFLMMFRLL